MLTVFLGTALCVKLYPHHRALGWREYSGGWRPSAPLIYWKITTLPANSHGCQRGLYYLHHGGMLHSHYMREGEKGQTFHGELPLGIAIFYFILGVGEPGSVAGWPVWRNLTPRWRTHEAVSWCSQQSELLAVALMWSYDSLILYSKHWLQLPYSSFPSTSRPTNVLIN